MAIHNAVRRCAYPFILEKFCLQISLLKQTDVDEYRSFRGNEVLYEFNNKFPRSGDTPFSDIVTVKNSLFKKNSSYFQEHGYTVIDWTTFQVTCNASFPAPVTNVTNDHFMNLGSESFKLLCESFQTTLGINGKSQASSVEMSSSEKVSCVEKAFQTYWNSVLLQHVPENIDSIPDLDIMSCHVKRMAFDILTSRKCTPSDFWSSSSINYALIAQNDLEACFVLDIVTKMRPAFEDLLCRHFLFSKDWNY